MRRDPIVEEVRRIRREIEAECQDDAQKFYEHLQELQERYGKRLVRRAPRPSTGKKKLAI